MYEWTKSRFEVDVTSYGRNKNLDDEINKTYPADCRKIAAVDSNKHDWDWKNRYWKEKIFVQKHFLSPIYFDGIS